MKYVFLLAVVASTALAAFPGDPATPWTPEDLQAGLEFLGPPPLPLQGVRLSVWVGNRTGRTLGPVPAVEDRCRVLVRGPGDADFRLAADALPLPEPLAPDPRAERRRVNQQRPRFLEPRGRQHVSFPLVASWSRGDGGRPVARPLFPAPGTYRLRWVYLEAEAGRPAVSTEVTVVVEAPRGIEAEATTLLRGEDELLSILLHPHTEPTAAEVVRLEEFLAKFGGSRWAPYAHYSLVRHHLRLLRAGGREWRLHEARAQIQVNLAHFPRFFTDKPGNEMLRAWSFMSFPYLADLSRRRREVLPVPETGPMLDPNFTDAVEWLGEFAGRFSGEEWDAFRRRQPPWPNKAGIGGPPVAPKGG